MSAKLELNNLVDGAVNKSTPASSPTSAATSVAGDGRKHKGLYAGDVRFTRKTVNNIFRDGNTMEQTVLIIAELDLDHRKIATLQVFKRDGHYYTYENRKLAAYRLLMISKHIKNKLRCEVIETTEKEWADNFDSDVEGLTILVQNGKFEIGDDEESSNFPLTKIRATKPVGSAKTDSQVQQILSKLGDDNFQGER